MTIPGRWYVLCHVVTGRWVAKAKATYFWHALRKRAVRVRGGRALDRLLAERRVQLVKGKPEMGCDLKAVLA